MTVVTSFAMNEKVPSWNNRCYVLFEVVFDMHCTDSAGAHMN